MKYVPSVGRFALRTDLEARVAKLSREGLNDALIAQRLGVSKTTVATTRKRAGISHAPFVAQRKAQ